MKNNAGFTMVELMVGSLVLLLVIFISTSFFRAQSQYGGELVKETGVHESISLATMLIRRDIMQAGFGFSKDKKDQRYKLSIWADDVCNNAFHRLYVSNAQYASILPQQPYTIFSDKANIGAVLQGITTFTLPSIRPQDSDGVLAVDTTGQHFLPTSASYDSATLKTTFSISSGTTSGPFVPALSYSLYDPSSNSQFSACSGSSNVDKLELRRASVGLVGGLKDPNLGLLDFRVRFLIVDPITFVESWIPDSTHTTFPTTEIVNVKAAEVLLKYKILRAGKDRSKSYYWKEQSKLFNINLRNLSLGS
jgi:hypothetical protein